MEEEEEEEQEEEEREEGERGEDGEVEKEEEVQVIDDCRYELCIFFQVIRCVIKCTAVL